MGKLTIRGSHYWGSLKIPLTCGLWAATALSCLPRKFCEAPVSALKDCCIEAVESIRSCLLMYFFNRKMERRHILVFLFQNVGII